MDPIREWTDPSALAKEWRELRRTILDLAEQVPETRVYRNSERAGWTLKHELSHLAALDTEVMHLIASAREGLVEHVEPAIRRRKGQAMHAAQEMRFTALREHLALGGVAAAEAIEGAQEALAAAVSVAGDAPRPIAEILNDRLTRARDAVTVLRQFVPGA